MSSSNTSQFDPEGGLQEEKNSSGEIPDKQLIIFDFNGDYTDEDKARFELTQKSDLQKICFYLNTESLSLPEIAYHVYSSHPGKQEADPHHSISRASARFAENAIYRYWDPQENPSFPHEITHLVTHTWGEPYILTTELDTASGQKIIKDVEMVSTSFMQEGLAIAVDDILFQRTLKEGEKQMYPDDYCRNNKNLLPTSLTQVINLEGSGSFPNEVVVPFTASLSKFLLGEIGLEKYKKLYISLKETLSPEENVANLEEIIGTKEQEVLAAWRDSIHL